METGIEFARETLERYAGCDICEFQPYMILTNFWRYLEHFSKVRNVSIHHGAMFSVCHDPSIKTSMMDIKFGSPAAALAIDLLYSLELRACVFLGMCGGLRRHYLVGDYLIPIAAIRAEGTSDFYFDSNVPALGNFVVEMAISQVLTHRGLDHHKGIVHTTNKRFWEFNKEFVDRLHRSGAQGIEMECATLFMASYFYRLPLGALLLVSDLPMNKKSLKTKKSSQFIYDELMPEHVDLGIEVVAHLDHILESRKKQISRKDLFY